MTDPTTAMRQAREALKHGIKELNFMGMALPCMPLHEAIAAIDAELAKVPKHFGWVSRTGHGTYFREQITPELAALEFGGNRMWTPVYTFDAALAKVQEPVGVVQHLHELNDPWISKLPIGTKLYIAPPAPAATVKGRQ